MANTTIWPESSTARTEVPRPFAASEAMFAAMMKIGTRSEVEPGTMLFKAGDENRGVYLVVSGRFALWSGDDPVRVTRVAERSCLMGLPATVRMKPYGLTAEAVTEAEVCLVGAEEFRNLIASNTDLGAEVLQLLAEEISVLRRLKPYEV